MSSKDSDDVVDIFGEERQTEGSNSKPPSREAPSPPPSIRRQDLSRMISEEPILASIPTPTSR